MRNNLAALFPDGIFSSIPAVDPSFYSLPIENGYFLLDSAELNERELALLQSFLPKSTTSYANHPWYAILFENQELPKGTYRVIQLKVTPPKEFLKVEWIKNLRDLFPQMVDFFQINEDYLLIETCGEHLFTEEDLSGIFLTIDSDFETKTKGFIGNWFKAADNFATLFAEERKIFLEEIEQFHQQSFVSLPSLFLHYFTKNTFGKSPLIRAYQTQLPLDSETIEIIQTLWDNHGNLSSAAKALFMHRNTLQYKIEKFEQTTQLNLRTIDDLLFAYLLIGDKKK
jgi:DNA-binding PucR family transcriptional regulator